MVRNNMMETCEARNLQRWKEYFCLSPMIESDGMITAETLGAQSLWYATTTGAV